MFYTYNQQEIDSVKKDIARGCFDQVTDRAVQQLNTRPGSTFKALIDSLAVNEAWREAFQSEFNKMTALGANFDLLTDEDKAKLTEYRQQNFIIDVSTDLDNTMVTDIFPVVEGLLINTDPLLSRVTYVTPSQGKIDLDEFGGEVAAESLAENGAGTEADDVIRDGDSLDANKKKIQASTTISRQAIRQARPQVLAFHYARLVNRVKARMQLQILSGDNGTNNFLGIVNSFSGTEGNEFGSLAFTPTTPVNSHDTLDQMSGDLPNTLDASIESNFAYIMTPKAWKNKIKNVRNGDDILLLSQEERSQSRYGNNVVVQVSNGLTDSQAVYCNLSNYVVALGSGLELTDDQGLSAIKNDQVTVVARQYCDGGMIMAHKNTVGAGAGANDNQARNLFRHTTI